MKECKLKTLYRCLKDNTNYKRKKKNRKKKFKKSFQIDQYKRK